MGVPDRHRPESVGRVGHCLFRDHGADLHAYADKLANLDWRKTAPIWQGNIILASEKNGKVVSKVLTQQGPLSAAFKAACDSIGLDPKGPSNSLFTEP